MSAVDDLREAAATLRFHGFETLAERLVALADKREREQAVIDAAVVLVLADKAIDLALVSDDPVHFAIKCEQFDKAKSSLTAAVVALVTDAFATPVQPGSEGEG
jgi:hypothetical protein